MASAAGRTRIAPPENLSSPPQFHLTPSQVARDLRELCDMGMVEKFKDEYGITRYRPTNDASHELAGRDSKLPSSAGNSRHRSSRRVHA